MGFVRHCQDTMKIQVWCGISSPAVYSCRTLPTGHVEHFCSLPMDEVLTHRIATASVMFNPSFMFNVYCDFFLDHK